MSLDGNSTHATHNKLLDIKLLDIVACPICKGKVIYNKTLNELWCRGDRLAYPINQGIPALIESEARHLTLEEIES